jgi:hypothetical protein
MLFEGEREGNIQPTSGIEETHDKQIHTPVTSSNPKGKPSKIPITTRPRSERISTSHPTLSYHVLNNPAPRGPREWQHHVPVTEDTGQIAKDIALMVDTLDTEPFSVEEAKNRLAWPKWKEAMDAEMDQLKALGTYTAIVIKFPFLANGSTASNTITKAILYATRGA